MTRELRDVREHTRLGRALFVRESVANSPELSWSKEMIGVSVGEILTAKTLSH